jgi:hypothetical protein
MGGDAGDRRMVGDRAAFHHCHQYHTETVWQTTIWVLPKPPVDVQKRRGKFDR